MSVFDTMQASGATVQVANDMLPNSTERSVMVSGTTAAIMHCIQRLCTIVAEVREEGSAAVIIALLQLAFC